MTLYKSYVAACPALGIYSDPLRLEEIKSPMRKYLSLPSAFLLFILASVMPAAAGDLRAGAAKTVITPDVHAATVYIAGYGQNRVATGVHDDLYARCLALGAGDQTLVVCAADLIGLFYDDVLKIRERVKAQAPEVTHLIVASTHDHEGPDTMGLWGPGPLQSGIDEKYMAWLRERIAQTAVEAVRSMQPARLTLGRDDHPLLALLQSDSRPPYVKDPYLFVMHVAAATGGQPIANLINWSDHPETLGGKNTEITADYPHWLCQYVESAFGRDGHFPERFDRRVAFHPWQFRGARKTPTPAMWPPTIPGARRSFSATSLASLPSAP